MQCHESASNWQAESLGDIEIDITGGGVLCLDNMTVSKAYPSMLEVGSVDKWSLPWTTNMESPYVILENPQTLQLGNSSKKRIGYFKKAKIALK